MPRPRGSAELVESRRHRGLALLDDGRSLNEVGRLLACAPSSVMRWRDARRRGGRKALKVGASPGRPPKLHGGERRRLDKILLRGAMDYGYATDLWTTTRIAKVVEREIGFRWVVETEQIDFPGRIEGDIGPAGCVFGSIVALMHPYFADGNSHFVVAAGRCIGQRNTYRAGLCASCASAPSVTAAATSGNQTGQQ